MEQEKTMTGTESMELISRMIKTVRNEIEDDSFYYLFWGWLVLIASIGHYVLLKANYANAGVVWLLMPVGGVVTMIYGYRQEKRQKVKSFLDDVMKYVLIAFAVSLIIVLIFMDKLGMATYPMIMMVYGMWLFVSGGAIRFRPLIAGGIVNWLLGIAAFFTDFPTQLLLLAAAVLLGYIIPGYLLRSKYKTAA